jgi:acetolactate synthase-1/2/3 large subunit
MGYGLGAAAGVAVAVKKRKPPIVLFTGDGSFRMNCAELATLKNEGLSVLVVILNNGVLGMVRQWQTLFFEKHYSQTDLGGPPDFVKLADSYGHAGFRAKDEASFLTVLKSACAELKKGNCAVIDALIDIDEMVFPMVPGGKPIEEQIVG